MHLTRNILSALECLDNLDVTLSDLILSILSLQQEELDRLAFNAINNLASNHVTLLDAFRTHSTFAGGTKDWILNYASKELLSEVDKLTHISTGWHGNAQNARIEQFESIQAEPIANTAKKVAPAMWAFFDRLLIKGHVPAPKSDRTDDRSMDDDIEGDQGEGEPEPDLHSGIDRVAKLRELRVVCFITAITRIKNQKCNLFANNFGLFLHASGAASRAINTMSQIGLSASMPSIDKMVHSLSRESYRTIRSAAQSMKYMLAYDNLVIDFGSPGQSIVEKSQKSLWNLTTGTYINHHYNMEDLRCAEEIRKHDRYNDEEAHGGEPQHNYFDLLGLHAAELDADGFTSHQRFFAWILRNDLCNHGPPFFRVFKHRVGCPETVEQLPIRTTDQVPVQATKHDNSTVSGNIDAIKDMLKQGGIARHSPDEDPISGEPPELSEYVLIVSGDLGTGERIDSARRRRALDICSWNTLYYVIFVPGMFHVKMALTDMLWKLFIRPFATESDPTSAGKAANYLCPRPKDANKLVKGPPTYQLMKRFLKHLGVAERLTAWRTALELRFGSSIWSDLEDQKFNAQFTLRFSWDNLVAMSNDLVRSYFSIGSVRARKQTTVESALDRELQNTMYRNCYMLLYEETIYAMNWGDIGRLERCLIDWIPAFRAVGKHKYAHHLTTFLINVHFVYPGPLKNAIRQSVLCNLSGKPGKFQGNDWVVELNNLYTKVVYGGSGSNRTVDRIIEESSLIQVYRNVMTSIDSLFLLGPQLLKHGEPDMSKTYAELVRELHANGLFLEQAGRTSKKDIIDAFHIGFDIIEDKGIGCDNDEDERGTLEETITHFDEDDLANGIDIH